MKIIFLTRCFYPDVGGVEKHVLELSKILVKKGHNVTVLTESDGKNQKIYGMNIKRIGKIPNNWFKKFYIWKWMMGNRGIFKEADIIHAHDVYFWYFPLKILFPLKKSFITFHGYESYPVSRKAIILRKLSEVLADGNICVGEFMKKWYGTKPDKVIYGGVDLPKKLTKPKTLHSAVFIGRLDEQTGVLEYARAMDLVREKYSGFRFKIVGNGKYFGKLKKYDPIGFKADVTYYLQDSNFVFVSRYLSILEALANKRLIFAIFDNPLKEDYLRLSPFVKYIIIESSAKELAKKVQSFLKEEKAKNKLVEEGYEWVKMQSWDKVCEAYLSLWREKAGKTLK